MSVRVMATVWQDAKEYREGPLLVLLALADWANDEGWCWPSVPAIAEKARLTERQVYNVLAGLKRDGVIVRQGGGGRGKSTRYRVVVSALGRRKNPEVVSGFPETAETPNPETVSGFPEDEKTANPEAHCRVSEGKNPEIETVNPEIGDTKTLKLDASPYIEPSIEPSKAKSNTPLPPSQARGERGEELGDGDGEIADAVVTALRVAGKREQRRLREVLLTVIAQERAESGIDGEELQAMLVDSWADYRSVAPDLRWAVASPAKFFAYGLWRPPESWPFRDVFAGSREATVGMQRGGQK